MIFSWFDRLPALLVIDVQCGFDDPIWGHRNNPDAESNIARLIARWRAAHATIIHVHHDSPHADGRLRRDAPGHLAKAAACPRADEAVYKKQVNSAFIGTTLERDLRAAGLDRVVIVGLTTNHCVSTTARMAGNLGFDTIVVSDATATFDRRQIDGSWRAADDVHCAALSDLSEEFACIATTEQILSAVGGLTDALATPPAPTTAFAQPVSAEGHREFR